MKVGQGSALAVVMALTLNGCGSVSSHHVAPSDTADSGAGETSTGGSNAGGSRASGGNPASGGSHASGGNQARGGEPASGEGGSAAAAGSGSSNEAGTAGKPPVSNPTGPARDPECLAAVNVPGDLKVGPDAASSGLVANVWGSVTIEASATSLADLRCLETVGGGLNIQLENGELDALSRLRTVDGDLIIEGNSTIRDLSGLASLGSIGGSLSIRETSALVDLSGADLLGFVGGSLTIQGNSALTSLKGLTLITDVKDLKIIDNASLENVDALSNLVGNGTGMPTDVDIENNDALSSLAGLKSLHETGELTIRDNALLPDLHGLEGLTQIQAQVWIAGNAALGSLKGLSRITQIGDLLVDQNPSLSELAGLDGLQGLYYARFTKNPKLSNCAIQELVTRCSASSSLLEDNGPCD